MGKQTLTLSSKVLISLLITGDLVLGMRGRIIDRVYRAHLDPDRHLKRTLYYLHKKGYIRSEDKQGKRLIKLTKQGKLKTLLLKFDVDKTRAWDGKWRVVMYDIPQSVSHLRFLLIHQLRKLEFVKLQGSVYISPFVLNDSAMKYLKTTGLMEFIRILTVEKIDDDRDLRKRFKLS